jgi:cobalt/nickel transport system permease protein
MHIPDGILSLPVLATTGAAAAGAVAVGLRKMETEDVPRVGVMASVFFVASLIRVPVGASSAHLLLPGLMGLVLGWTVFPALAVALFLQAVLFGFGGVTSLGANVVTMGLPALLCYYIFGGLIARMKGPESVFGLAFAAGASGIVVACAVLGAVLVASGKEYAAFALAVLGAHVPVMAIEGFVTGAAVSFLRKVKPVMLARPRAARREEGRVSA